MSTSYDILIGVFATCSHDWTTDTSQLLDLWEFIDLVDRGIVCDGVILDVEDVKVLPSLFVVNLLDVIPVQS